MIDVTAFIMGTCRPQRLAWLEQTVDYLDSQDFPFVKKILSIDEFDGYTFPVDLLDKFRARGWFVIIDNHKSRYKSMINALSYITSEYIFYNEEDVMATMPRMRDLDEVFNIKIQNRACGMISLTLGGSTNHFPANEYGDLKDVDKNLILSTNEYLIFRRLESKRNAYFFEFPGLFVNTEMFRTCTRYAQLNFAGQSIEQGLTSAYFELSYDRDYYKASVAKTNIFEVIENDPNAFIRDCRLLDNLDPNQGNSSSGGNHFF